MQQKIVLPFLTALALLTRFPVPRSTFADCGSEAACTALQARSTLFYSLVGALLAMVMGMVSVITSLAFSPLVQALVVVVLWIVLTGALHLDGLADCVDAAFASHKDPRRTLAVLRDPAAGPMAVIALVLVVLTKMVFIAELLMTTLPSMTVLILTLAISRQLAVLYMAATPYARQEGMVSALDLHGYQVPLFVISLILCLLCFFLLGLLTLLIVLAGVGTLFFLWRRYWLKKLGGYTGDCVGALIELSELVILFIFLLFR